jgi:hypothetical protein
MLDAEYGVQQLSLLPVVSALIGEVSVIPFRYYKTPTRRSKDPWPKSVLVPAAPVRKQGRLLLRKGNTY